MDGRRIAACNAETGVEKAIAREMDHLSKRKGCRGDPSSLASELSVFFSGVEIPVFSERSRFLEREFNRGQPGFMRKLIAVELRIKLRGEIAERPIPSACCIVPIENRHKLHIEPK